MYISIPIHTLKTMQDVPHVDHRTLKYLAIGTLAVCALVVTVVISV